MLNVIAARAALYGRTVGTNTFAWGMNNIFEAKDSAQLPCSVYQDTKEDMYMQDLYKCQQRQHQQPKLPQETTSTKTNREEGQHHLCTKVFSQTTFALPEKKARH